ncbi:hypothetical protein A1507_19840 [Methylomonas koyamae]|uniref:Phage capsid protein n=1 Tax=Methylomonas koyamae TaxID=702114 RepID=A0A177N1M0_9GAMM|nr:major capsid protein [Methylomonas koyamae]OAI11782.1 hypothetical protein A1507_19840 [Methylomonas koyamae]
MTQMSTGGARVVNAVLTSVARGYRNAKYVGLRHLPYVPVNQRGGKVITFNKEAWRQYQLARAPGSQLKRVSFGYAGNDFALVQHALEGVAPIELADEAAKGPGIDLGRSTVIGVQDIIDLRLEIAQATLLTTAANYGAGNKVTLSGTSQWNDYTNSDPIGDVDTAKEAVRAQIGIEPNVMTVSAKVWKVLKRHPKLVDAAILNGIISVNGNSAPSRLSKDQMAALFEVDDFEVGGAVSLDASDAVTDVWGKDVLLSYSVTAALANMGTPTFGYTYRLAGYPMVETGYYENQTRSWIYPCIDEVAPVIAGAEAGYLIKSAVA